MVANSKFNHDIRRCVHKIQATYIYNFFQTLTESFKQLQTMLSLFGFEFSQSLKKKHGNVFNTRFL